MRVKELHAAIILHVKWPLAELRVCRWLAGQGDVRGAQRAMRALAEPREAARELAEMGAQARGRRDAPDLRQLLRAPALRRQLTLGAPHAPPDCGAQLPP